MSNSPAIGHRINTIKQSILRRCTTCKTLPTDGLLCSDCQKELRSVLDATPTQLDELEERYCGTKTCPKCGDECRRDEVHNGLALLCGPWGCPSCQWSEDGRYDSSNGARAEFNGGLLDQYGGYTPPNTRVYLPFDRIHDIYHSYGRLVLPLPGSRWLIWVSKAKRFAVTHRRAFHNCTASGIH